MDLEKLPPVWRPANSADLTGLGVEVGRLGERAGVLWAAAAVRRIVTDLEAAHPNVVAAALAEAEDFALPPCGGAQAGWLAGRAFDLARRRAGRLRWYNARSAAVVAAVVMQDGVNAANAVGHVAQAAQYAQDGIERWPYEAAAAVHLVGGRDPAQWAWLYATYLHARGPEGAEFDPAWRTDTAVSLAKEIAATRQWGLVPVLADALQEAGCAHAGVLAHLRNDADEMTLADWALAGLLCVGKPDWRVRFARV